MRKSNYMKKQRYDILMMIVKLLNILLLTVPFALSWTRYYAGRIALPLYDKGNYAVIALFVVLYVIFSNIFDALLISYTQVCESIYSQLLALLFADGIMFAVLYLLTEKLSDLFLVAITFLFQMMFAVIWAFFSHKWYFSTFPAKKTAVIYDVRRGLERLIEEYGLSKKFDVQVIVSVDECLDNIHLLDGVDVVFLSGLHSHDRNIILKYCVIHNIFVYVIPSIGDTIMCGAKRMHMFHLPILRVERCRPFSVYMCTKRLFDVVVSIIGIIALSPLMIATAIAIKAADGGPILYSQIRLTKGGKRFNMLKFRSMKIAAEEDGVARLSTGENDDRITPVGRIIRKVRIDELPQLFCILFGTMSVVGPRPERPEIAAQYEEEMPEFALRLQVKAGLTGYAQVYGKYNTTPDDKLKMDLMYIANLSAVEDFKIIFATFKILFMPKSTEGIVEGATTAMGAERCVEDNNK